MSRYLPYGSSIGEGDELDHEGNSLAEELLRLVAVASTAARLYPATSPIPEESLEKLVRRSNEITNSLGGLRFTIDPNGFALGDKPMSPGQTQITWLAETLHSMQGGQLVIAPGITPEEARSFIHIVNSDPASVRQRSIRSLLTGAGVTHLAVIEVSLRASTEDGLLGVDIINAPLEEIGTELTNAVTTWQQSAEEGAGSDDLFTVMDRMEEATRGLAASRIVQALMMLDEPTRLNLLEMSLKTDTAGQRMSGMFDVISRMNPSALARLLKMTAQKMSIEPDRLAQALELPASVFESISLLLSLPSQSESAEMAPDAPDVEMIALELAMDDAGDLGHQLSKASPVFAAGKALHTNVTLSAKRPDADSIKAIGESLVPAISAGAFSAVMGALNRLDELQSTPALALDIEQARARIQDVQVLLEACRSASTDAEAAMAGDILRTAGSTGADALLLFLAEADQERRSLFRPVLRGMVDQLLTSAGRMIRTEDSSGAISILKALAFIADKRAVPVIVQALENLDAAVRRRAVTTLADIAHSESRTALSGAVAHWDPETQRFAIKEIARVGATEAIPALVRILEDINIFDRNHELRKAIVRCLGRLDSPIARRSLEKLASRRFILGRQGKELRFLARQALVESPQSVQPIDMGAEKS